MFGRERATAHPPDGRAHEGGRHEPEPPAELALALQRAAGNHATGRVLARYTAANKDKYDAVAGQPAVIREFVAAVLQAHKATFTYKLPREPLVAPLQATADKLAEILGRWEKTTDATDERAIMKEIGPVLTAAKEQRASILDTLGPGALEGVKNVLETREKQRAAAEQGKREAAEAAAKKEADAKRQGELLALFPIKSGTRAYDQPADDKIEQFREHVALSHRAFSGLTSAQLREPNCPLYLLSADQLKSVQDKVGSASLSGWRPQSTPDSRRAALGFETWIVPTKSDVLGLELGGEIFSDWVVENPNHGFSLMRLMQIWSFVRSGNAFVKVTVGRDTEGEATGKKVYENKLNGRTETKVVTARNDTVLITCFDTGRRG